MQFKLSRSPSVLFKLLFALVIIVVSIGIYVTLNTTGTLDSTSSRASEQAELAQLAAESSDRLRGMIQIMQTRIDGMLASPEFAALTESQRSDVTMWLIGGNVEAPATFAGQMAALSVADAAAFQADLDYLMGRVLRLVEATNNENLRALRESNQEVLGAVIRRYYDEPTLANLRDMRLAITGTQVYVSGEVPRLSQEALTLREDLSSSIDFLRWAVLGLGVSGGMTILVLGFYMFKTTQGLLDEARNEQGELAELTENLEYRNKQLNALYNVFNEITDTLSLRYVVRATMFESLKIMRADMVVLRILRGEYLEPVGAMTASEKEIEGLLPVKLGEGPTGRTAKRGRTLRIDEGGERMMAPPDGESDHGAPSRQGNLGSLLESGLIVPLIVGARIVGTISCWSREKFAFSDSDERVLEMMASQVATAIAAADTTEKSERRAHQDPLTALPNRRQLDEDIAGRLAELAATGRQAVIAMVDIDHFKRFNDDFGHRVGDVTLQKVANVLRTSARDNDLVYRYGGEEFVVVFADTRPEDALMLANRLRQAVEDAPLIGEHLNPVGPVTVSVGLALLPQHGINLNDLIAMADKAMYAAKANGRNRVEVWPVEEAPGELNEVA